MAAARPIYLDNAATTLIDPQVAQAMHDVLLAGYANPASQHKAGREARKILEESREAISLGLGSRTKGMEADRLIFTSGGTEANLLALLGLGTQEPRRIIVSAAEHSSIRSIARHLERRGVCVDQLPVDRHGLCDLSQLIELLDASPKPQLVSILHTNNETGVMQPTVQMAIECRRRGIQFHTDAAHAMEHWVLWPEPYFSSLEYSAMTIVPHKFHGPVGIGALLLRHDVQLEPLVAGGFHQGGLRPGTESVALAVGFRAALEILLAREATNDATNLREEFEGQLRSELEDLVVVGESAPRAPHISNIAFLGVDRQQLFLALDFAGVFCSTGSACASGSSEPSPVLLAMGLPAEVVSSSLRFSFSAFTTLADVHEAADRIVLSVNKLRSQNSKRK